MSMMNRILLFTFIAVTTALSSHAQEGAAREYVTGTFAGTQVVNAPSVEVVPRKRSFGFMIQHRFGAPGPDEQALKQFAGLDLPANIRFSFQYSPIDGAHLELGRSKNGKVWDLGVKARVLKQTVEDEMPLSITVLANTSLITDDFPAEDANDYFADRTTPFAYRFDHRLSYNVQAIIARRFSKRFSLQVAPISIYRNLVPIGGSNHQIVLACAARMKVTTKGSIMVEAGPTLLGRQPGQVREPLSVAYEVATLGHVFQVVVSSSQEIIEQRLYPTPASPYTEGYMHLGFNIARTLFVKPRSLKP